MQKKQTKKLDVTANGVGEMRFIPLNEIELTPANVRKSFDQKKFAELVKSVKGKGILQAILLRPHPAPTGAIKYQIVAGERRFRAATEAGLNEIPAYIKVMDDVEALSAGITENLVREDIHPLDEADGYLRLKEELKLTVRQIAERVAKDIRYVVRQLTLTCLIEEARADFFNEHLTLSHALEICRLDPEIQSAALLACYEVKPMPGEDDETEFVADKTKPCRSVRYLQEWLEKNVHLNLKTAPFKLDDTRLREDGLTCLACPQRSGYDKLLFADIKDADTCLNPLCFQAKEQALVQITKAAVQAKQEKPVASISSYYGARTAEEGTLGKGDYQLLPKKADRCAHAEQAVLNDGPDLGKAKWICREPSCKDHLGRVSEYAAPVATPLNATNGTDPHAARHTRKQELFDIKVDEAVRKRVFSEALNVFAWPLERRHLNGIAKEFFRRIPNDVQKTICEVLGWNEELAGKVRHSDSAVLEELGKLDDNQLAQFLMLCSFAHYGANQYGNRQVDQSLVVGLSQKCNVNHTLIEAEVRAELAPKKYQAAHQAYLEAVKSGRLIEKPVVYEQTT
jgi:ParB/RepB/Spo0J family partition protein